MGYTAQEVLSPVLKSFNLLNQSEELVIETVLLRAQ